MLRTRRFVLLIAAAGLWFGACDQDNPSKDTTTPGEDVIAADTPSPADTLADTPPVEDAMPWDFGPDGPPTDSGPDAWMLDVPYPEDIIFDLWDVGDIFGLDFGPDGPPADLFDEDMSPDVHDVSIIPEACCLSDEDCEDIGDGGWTCAWGQMQAANPDWGRCMGPLGWQEGGCWDDGDCTDDQVCMGAAYCPCDLGCGMADFPGQCQDPDELGDIGDLCGQSGGDCKPDLVCCYPCGIPDCQWKCAEPCDEDEVWCAGGCPMLP